MCRSKPGAGMIESNRSQQRELDTISSLLSGISKPPCRFLLVFPQDQKLLLPCRQPGWRPQPSDSAPAMASLHRGELPGADAPPASPPAVVAHVPARGVGRAVRRVALLHGDGHPARHARRVVRLHPRRPRPGRRRRQERRCMQKGRAPRRPGSDYARMRRAYVRACTVRRGGGARRRRP